MAIVVLAPQQTKHLKNYANLGEKNKRNYEPRLREKRQRRSDVKHTSVEKRTKQQTR
jgi:hypothetical protein